MIDEATVRVDFGGVTRDVLTGFDRVKSGDLVMVHSGVIIGRTTEAEIVTNLGLFMEAEKIGLQDLGLEPLEAKRKAEEEFKTLLGSLGLDPAVYMPDGNSSSGGRTESGADQPRVPSFAYKERFRTSLSDMDYLQVMHYTNYFRLVERAWMGLLASIGYAYSSMIHKQGLFIPTVETAGKILAPVRMDSEIETSVWVEEIGRKHVRYHGIITNLTSRKVAADIHHTAVCTDTTLMESAPLPAELRSKLSAFLAREGEKGNARPA